MPAPQKNAFTALLKISAVAALPFVAGFLIYYWIVPAIPGMAHAYWSRQGTSSLLKEARRQNIVYEQVLLSPAKTLGMPAVWCLQNRGDDKIYYQGDEMKRVHVSNHMFMPFVYGDKHSACRDMLVIIRGIKKTKISSLEARERISVQFLKQL